MAIKTLLTTLCCIFFITLVRAQGIKVTISGQVKSAEKGDVLPFVNVVLKTEKDSIFIAGTITNEQGRFSIADIKSGNYKIECVSLGYKPVSKIVTVGTLSPFLDLGIVSLAEESQNLQEVTVTGDQAEGVDDKMDRKTFNIGRNVSQSGGSVLQALKNLPGLTAGEDGKVLLRGSDKVAILVDGRQTALTGFGSQTSLDNIPASAIERIEIINNPSARYDANGNAGIINIIYKKEKREGFNGKIGMAAGLGALWVRKENLPDIRPQYRNTLKLNPSSL